MMALYSAANRWLAVVNMAVDMELFWEVQETHYILQSLNVT